MVNVNFNKQQLLRGEKWTKVKKTLEFKGDTRGVKWMESQPAIQEDISAYLIWVEEERKKEERKKEEEAKKVETKSKGKK